VKSFGDGILQFILLDIWAYSSSGTVKGVEYFRKRVRSCLQVRWWEVDCLRSWVYERWKVQ
jgi:hypothetical protein